MIVQTLEQVSTAGRGRACRRPAPRAVGPWGARACAWHCVRRAGGLAAGAARRAGHGIYERRRTPSLPTPTCGPVRSKFAPIARDAHRMRAGSGKPPGRARDPARIRAVIRSYDPRSAMPCAMPRCARMSMSDVRGNTCVLSRRPPCRVAGAGGRRAAPRSAGGGRGAAEISGAGRAAVCVPTCAARR